MKYSPYESFFDLFTDSLRNLRHKTNYLYLRNSIFPKSWNILREHVLFHNFSHFGLFGAKFVSFSNLVIPLPPLLGGHSPYLSPVFNTDKKLEFEMIEALETIHIWGVVSEPKPPVQFKTPSIHSFSSSLTLQQSSWDVFPKILNVVEELCFCPGLGSLLKLPLNFKMNIKSTAEQLHHIDAKTKLFIFRSHKNTWLRFWARLLDPQVILFLATGKMALLQRSYFGTFLSVILGNFLDLLIFNVMLC